MSASVGIDMGFDSQVVEKYAAPAEGPNEVTMVIQTTEGGNQQFEFEFFMNSEY